MTDPKKKPTCEVCGSTDIVRDEVDVGVGMMYGPWHCHSCGWTEGDGLPIPLPPAVGAELGDGFLP